MKITIEVTGYGEDHEGIDRALGHFVDSIKVIQSIDSSDEKASEVVDVFGLTDPLDVLGGYVVGEWLPRWFTVPADDFEISLTIE